MTSPSIALALVNALDDSTLDVLAARLAPRLLGHLSATVASDGDGWMDSRQAAHYLGVTMPALYRLSAARRLPSVQACNGGKLWFRRAQLDEWRTHGG